jgi:hypothetical protein
MKQKRSALVLNGMNDTRWFFWMLCLVWPSVGYAEQLVPTLVFSGMSQDKAGKPVWEFKLTAPTKRAIFYQSDQDTALVISDVQQRRLGRWISSGPWMARPRVHEVLAGKTVVLKIPVTDVKRDWRLRLRVFYDRVPSVKSEQTDVWSQVVPVK